MLLRYGAVTPLRAELPDDELAWLEASATVWEAGRLRQLVGGFGDALAKLRDPAQLLVQVELIVLGGVPSAEPSSASVPEVRREGPPRAAIPFTPARSARTTPSAPAAPPPAASPPAPASSSPAPAPVSPPPAPAPASSPPAAIPVATVSTAPRPVDDSGASHFRP